MRFACKRARPRRGVRTREIAAAVNLWVGGRCATPLCRLGSTTGCCAGRELRKHNLELADDNPGVYGSGPGSPGSRKYRLLV